MDKDNQRKNKEIKINHPERLSFQVQNIFQSEDFNKLSLDEFENKFRNEINFQELKIIKLIYSDILKGCCLREDQLDYRGNRLSGWAENEIRGNKPYYPPIGWIGFGLKVKGKYENDLWMGNFNTPGEWCIAYHGVGRGRSSDEIKRIIGLIYKTRFKPGPGQAHSHCSDIYREGAKVGVGVSISLKTKIAEDYAGISEINGKKYKSV